jgi:tRNA/tmRNA/rRNA uracil-C5-methylase (TrmA/RlmC/RlmD family)
MRAALRDCSTFQLAGHATAYKVRTVRASSDAAQPPCPHFGPCGGCQHQNLQYAAQLAEKQAQVGSPVVGADSHTRQKPHDCVHRP